MAIVAAGAAWLPVLHTGTEPIAALCFRFLLRLLQQLGVQGTTIAIAAFTAACLTACGLRRGQPCYVVVRLADGGRLAVLQRPE